MRKAKIKRLLKKATLGFPMAPQGYAFTDTVAGRPVFYYTDTLGRNWLAYHRWDLGRMRLNRELTVLDRVVSAGVIG